MALASPFATTRRSFTTPLRQNTLLKLRSSPLKFGHSCSSPPQPLFQLQMTHRSLACSSSIANSPVADIDLPNTSTATWSRFAEKVSGEWDGFGADFTNQGNPIELPESVVPEAYGEWEVKVFDWQTQCPTLAKTNEQLLQYRIIKLLPTVGCEADAATRYTIDERSIGDDDVETKASAFAYHSSGSFMAVWPVKDDKVIELEYCLMNPLDRESRVRISQIIDLENGKMVVESIRVFRELWYGPFRNGDQLGGCAIRDSAFASTPAMEASEVVGVWEGSTSVADFKTSNNLLMQELVDGGRQKSVRNEDNLVLLPKQLWCSMQKSENGDTFSEVGWRFSPGCAITSRCIFSSDTNLKEISVSNESAVGNREMRNVAH